MRGKQAKRRKIKPDAVYNSILVSKLINKVMLKGRKSLAENIVYQSMGLLKADDKRKPLEVLEQAIDNVRPRLEVRPRRVGGVNYQVPRPVSEERQTFLALKWIVTGARSRRKKEEFSTVLSDEIKDAYKKAGFAMRKKEDMHKMAEANKAFAHFQW